MVVYQALMQTGEILESDTFKSLYHFALSHARGELYYSTPEECLTYLYRLCIAEYTDEVVLNEWGYNQHELVNRQEIGMVAVSRTGETVEYGRGIYEFERGAF